MIRKIVALALCFSAIARLASAQELGLELDGGLQGMRYPLREGQSKPLPGASLGIDYVFPLYNNVGLLTGITGGLYRTRVTLPNSLAFAYPQVDDRGTAFLYTVRFTGYQETQRTLAVTIPVLLQYHTDGDAAQWYIDAGGKIFLPAVTSVRVSAQQMRLSGYYPNYDLLISDLPKHGFGTVGGWNSSTSTRLKPGAALSAGTGVAFGIAPGARIYVGVYADYGLTALKTGGENMPIVTYSPKGIGNVKANGVLDMSNPGQPKLLSYGLQVRVTWGAGAAKHAGQRKNPDTVQAQPQFTVQVQTKHAAAHKIKQEILAGKKAETMPPSAAGAPISDNELMTIQRPVVFGIVGEADIPETQQPILDDVVTIMRQHPDLRVSIVGYTCDGVQQAEDARLGETRAKAVARYLERKGIDRRRMDISYSKESEPSKTYDPAANYRSRRVLISPE